jgi:uncharacterized delta-60 repeat protein
MNTAFRIVFAVLACAFISSCGGGGSGGQTSSLPNPEAVGQVDSSFGGGFVSMGSMGPVADIDALDDGSLLVGGGNSIDFPRGTSNAYVAKIRADGQPDGSFGSGGAFVEAGDGRRQSADKLRVIDANRIMVAETRGRICGPEPALFCQTIEFRDVVARRLDASGAPDASYGTNGTATLPRSEGAIVIAPDGRVTSFTPQLDVTHNGPLFTVASLDARGQRDTAFEARALASLNGCSAQSQGPYEIGFAVATMSGERYVVAVRPIVGPDTIVVSRLNPDGSPDTTFGNGGCQFLPANTGGVSPFPSKLLVRADGSMVVALAGQPNETPQSPPAFFMLDAQGRQVSPVRPAVRLAWIGDVAAQPNGKLVAAGLSSLTPASDPCAVRTSPDANALDPSFGDAGRASLATALGPMTPQKVLVLADGRIVVGGFATSGGSGLLMRLH